MTWNFPSCENSRQLAQTSARIGVRPVRLFSVSQGNQYTAILLEFDDNGEPQLLAGRVVTVTNLAEPPDATGQIESGTDTLAVDVEGRWIAHVRPSATTTFPAKITNSQGDSEYIVREQIVTGESSFADKQGASDISAHNLAELTLGPGGAVDTDTIVFVTKLTEDANPSNIRYFFDHPAYAKYLD